jgi:hypothetical protein
MVLYESIAAESNYVRGSSSTAPVVARCENLAFVVSKLSGYGLIGLMPLPLPGVCSSFSAR